MISDMDPNFLKTSELTYELKLRAIAVEDDATVDRKRKLLRGALSASAGNRSFSVPKNTYARAIDLAEIGVTLSDLDKVLNPRDGKPTANDLRRVESRLNHVFGRIKNIKPFAPSKPDEVDEVVDLMATLCALEADFAVCKDEIRQPPINLQLSTPNSHELSEFQSQQSSVTTPPPTFIPSHSKVYKWGIHFDASGSPESLLEFLDSVAELKHARGVTDSQLFAAASDLFRGDVKIWYRQNRSLVASWDELVALLKRRFLPSNYDSEIKILLDKAYQQPKENVSIFIARLETLYSRMSNKPPVEERIQHIRERLLPFFIQQTAVMEFSAITELDDICTRLERTRLSMSRYRANVPSNKSHLSEISSSIPEQKCFNCGYSGHSFPSCTERKKRFCYGCGQPNVIISTCKTCSKNVPASGSRGRASNQN